MSQLSYKPVEKTAEKISRRIKRFIKSEVLKHIRIGFVESHENDGVEFKVSFDDSFLFKIIVYTDEKIVKVKFDDNSLWSRIRILAGYDDAFSIGSDVAFWKFFNSRLDKYCYIYRFENYHDGMIDDLAVEISMFLFNESNEATDFDFVLINENLEFKFIVSFKDTPLFKITLFTENMFVRVKFEDDLPGCIIFEGSNNTIWEFFKSRLGKYRRVFKHNRKTRTAAFRPPIVVR